MGSHWRIFNTAVTYSGLQFNEDGSGSNVESDRWGVRVKSSRGWFGGLCGKMWCGLGRYGVAKGFGFWTYFEDEVNRIC